MKYKGTVPDELNDLVAPSSEEHQKVIADLFGEGVVSDNIKSEEGK